MVSTKTRQIVAAWVKLFPAGQLAGTSALMVYVVSRDRYLMGGVPQDVISFNIRGPFAVRPGDLKLGVI